MGYAEQMSRMIIEIRRKGVWSASRVWTSIQGAGPASKGRNWLQGDGTGFKGEELASRGCGWHQGGRAGIKGEKVNGVNLDVKMSLF